MGWHMRSSAVAACVTLGLLGCQTTGEPPSRVTQTVPAADGWKPNEKIVAENSSYSGSPSLHYRQGLTEEGYEYRIYNDKSASLKTYDAERGEVTDWIPTCRKDSMTDVQTCGVYNDKLGLLFTLNSSGVLNAFCVIHHDYPGRNAAIRIDDKPMISMTSGCIPANETQFTSGKKITIRWVKWPYDYYKETKGSIAGLRQALAFAHYVHFASKS